MAVGPFVTPRYFVVRRIWSEAHLRSWHDASLDPTPRLSGVTGSSWGYPGSQAGTTANR